MKEYYVEIFSVDMHKTYLEGWYSYDAGTTVLDILRDFGLEIEDTKTACTVIEVGNKKTVFVCDTQGFKFVVSFRAKVF